MSIQELKLYKTFGSKRIEDLAVLLGNHDQVKEFFTWQNGKAFDEYGDGADYDRYLGRADKAKEELLARVNGYDRQPEPESPPEPEPEPAQPLITREPEPEPEPGFEEEPETIEAEFVGRTETGGTSSQRAPLHELVAALIMQQAILFHDSEEAGFLRYKHKGHIETHPIESSGFKRYATYLAYKHFRKALSRESMTSLTGLLNAEAVFNGERRKVERRVAHRDGAYYIDIGDPEWHVIEIVPGQGWSILSSEQNPVCFTRSRNAQALPMPERGASVDALWEYANIPEGDRARVLTWVLETFRAETQYPILSLKAEAGSGKTETENTLRLLTDPNKALTSRAPNSTRDVLSNAQNNHVLAFDNMSHISDSLSDLLCCMATGSGHRERKLYTNLEEEVLELKRPVMFDGIEFLARRDDLVDRIIHVELAPLKRGDKVSEYDFKSRRKADLPLILGALLDLFVDATERVKSITCAPGVRMMDYSKFGQAVCDSLGNDIDCTAELRDHQTALKHRVLDDSPFLMLLLEILDNASDGERVDAGNWLGTAVTKCLDETIRFNQYPGKLLESMAAQAKDKGIRTTSWPMKPNGVIGLLDRNKIALLNLGLIYRKERIDNRGTLYAFVYDPKSENNFCGSPEDVDEK